MSDCMLTTASFKAKVENYSYSKELVSGSRFKMDYNNLTMSTPQASVNGKIIFSGMECKKTGNAGMQTWKNS